jgi:hypothetical protein
MSSKPDPLGPYATPEELAKGRRRAALMLVVGAAALVLAVVARRYVDDETLVRTYVLAGALHLVAAIGPIVRISRTAEFEHAD